MCLQNMHQAVATYKTMHIRACTWTVNQPTVFVPVMCLQNMYQAIATCEAMHIGACKYMWLGQLHKLFRSRAPKMVEFSLHHDKYANVVQHSSAMNIVSYMVTPLFQLNGQCILIRRCGYYFFFFTVRFWVATIWGQRLFFWKACGYQWQGWIRYVRAIQWRLLQAVSSKSSLSVLLPAVETSCTMSTALAPARWPLSGTIHIHVRVTAATIWGRHLFCSELPIMRLLSEGATIRRGDYSGGGGIYSKKYRSFVVEVGFAKQLAMKNCVKCA